LIKARRRISHPDPCLAQAAVESLDSAWQMFPLSKRPEIVWHDYRVTAGTANYLNWQIGLSLRVLTSPDQVRSTLFHEYAHLLAVQRQGSKAANHGLEWKKAMRDLGEVPVVRHQLQVQRNRVLTTVVYKCIQCNKEIVRKRKLPNHRRYFHQACGGTIRYLGLQIQPEMPQKPLL